MLKDVTLGQYFPGTTAVHRLDPRTKLVLVIVYIVALFLAKQIASYALVLVFLAAVIAISKIRLQVILKSMKPLLFIIILTGGFEPVLWQRRTACGVLDLQDHAKRHRKCGVHDPAHRTAAGGDVYADLYDLAHRADGRAGKSAQSAEEAPRAGA